MNEIVYYKDQYLKEIEAKIIKIDGNKILLDKTIFIPAIANELGDIGKINGRRISGSKKEGEEIWNILEKPTDFKEGMKVKLEIDWKNRISFMRYHSALHLLAGVSEKNFGKRAVAGVVKKNSAYLVFKDEINDEFVNKIMELADKDIEKGIEIESYWDEKRKGFRWTKINDYPPIPDGGLHVKNTKEIGKIKFLSKEKKDASWKMEITLV